VTTQPLSQTSTRLTGRRLAYARLAWGMIVLVYLGSFVLSLPVTLSQNRGFAQKSQDWTEVDTRASLVRLGISYETFRTYDTWSNLFITIFYFGLGLFIFWRRSDDWMALLFSTFFITFPGTVIFGTLAQYHPAWITVQVVTDSLSSLLFLALFIFPDGRFVPRWTRWVAFGYAGVQLWRLFQPDLYEKVALPFVMPIFLCIILSQVYRYRRVSSPSERQQTKWVVFGLSIGFTPLLVYLLVFLSNPGFRQPGALGMAFFLIGNILWTFSLVSLYLSVTLAILRSHLWDIDVIIRKTLIYGALTATLALVFFGGVVLLQQLIGGISGTQNSPVAIVISTLLIAALFTPLRNRIQRDIDRRFYRKKYDAEKTLEGFAVSVRDEVKLDELTSRLLAIVEETLQPENVSVWLIGSSSRSSATGNGKAAASSLSKNQEGL
jgi:hypothetical protein